MGAGRRKHTESASGPPTSAAAPAEGCSPFPLLVPARPSAGEARRRGPPSWMLPAASPGTLGQGKTSQKASAMTL